jgi:AIPR protein
MPTESGRKVQIETELESRFFPVIPDHPRMTDPVQLRKNRLSRSLAAFTIQKLADVTVAQAAASVIDAEDDNGIDAIYFDSVSATLWVAQAKCGGAPDLGESKKFTDGIDDLANSRFHKFNQVFKDNVQSEVEEALDVPGLKWRAAHVYLEGNLGRHVGTDMAQIAATFNQTGPYFEWQDCQVDQVHSWLTLEHALQPITVQLNLESYGHTEGPYRAFYGTIKATQLHALYATHGKRLFEKNIRHFLGLRNVNSEIRRTVQENPEQLFFRNNGITAVCSKVEAPTGNRRSGNFSFENFSIVNGAQTVGSIFSSHTPATPIADNATLLFTVIETDGNEEFTRRVTRSRNTQNAVSGIDYAALDPNQERLRRELAVSSIDYLYRPTGQATVAGRRSFKAEEAALALACFKGAVPLVVTAKKQIGLIYDGSGPIYPQLFTDGLTGAKLARLVDLYHYIDSVLEGSEKGESEFYRRLFFRHGRYFLMTIFARRERQHIDAPSLALDRDEKLEVSRKILELAETTWNTAETMFARLKGYLSIFRTLGDAEPLSRAVMEALTAQPPPPSPPIPPPSMPPGGASE